MPIASVDAAKHYTVNLVESLTLTDTMPIASNDQPKHYTVNLMESLTLEDEISKHVEISLDEKISLTRLFFISSETFLNPKFTFFFILTSLSINRNYINIFS